MHKPSPRPKIAASTRGTDPAIGCGILTLKPEARTLRRPRWKYFTRIAGENDLNRLYLHYHTLFGEDIVAQPQMASWTKKNGNIVTEVLRVHNPDEETKHSSEIELVGFFDIEPLKRSGRSTIQRPGGGIGAIKKSDIHSEVGVNSASSYYIGSIGCPKGSGRFLQGICMVFLIKSVQELCRGRRITVYTRPATDVGAYYVKEVFRMEKMRDGPDKEVVWYKEIGPGIFEVPGSYKKIVKQIEVDM